MTSSRRGLTLLEVLVVIGVTVIVLVVVVTLLDSRPHHDVRRIKDAANLRSITISFNTWANDNKGRYPTPSIVDRNNDVLLTTDPGEKNTSGAMMSLLIFTQMITPEIAVSPFETGPVEVMDTYEYTNPTGALNPAAALWDPKFKGTPKDNVPGTPTTTAHFSYAHLPLHTTIDATASSATLPLLSARGPLYEPDPKRPGAFRVSRADPTHGADSPAYLMHKQNNAWKGNILFQDAHFEYRSPLLDNGDHIFVRETPAPDGTPQDTFLRQYWRGVTFSIPFQPALGGTVVGTPDDPYTEPNGPHIYLDGDK